MEIAVYFAIVMASVTQSASTKAFNKTGGPSALFNAIKTLSAFVLFLIISLPAFTFHLPTLLYGAAHGVLLAIANQAGYKALHSGPMALTSMVANFSLIIPFAYGVVFLREKPTVFAYIGLALLLTALVFLNLRRRGGEDKRPSLKWAIFTGITMLANGLCSVVTSAHQSVYPEQFEYGYTAWTTVMCLLIFSVLALAGGKLKKQYRTARGDLLASGAGIVNTLSSFFTVLLAAACSASVLYPMLAATTMLAALIVGRFVFREKLTPFQLTGFALGVGSVVLFNI